MDLSLKWEKWTVLKTATPCDPKGAEREGAGQSPGHTNYCEVEGLCAFSHAALSSGHPLPGPWMKSYYISWP